MWDIGRVFQQVVESAVIGDIIKVSPLNRNLADQRERVLLVKCALLILESSVLS